MMTALTATTERARMAGWLLEDVARAVTTGEVPSDKELRASAPILANLTNALWGALAGLAGKQYLDSLREPGHVLFRATSRLAELQVMAACIDGSQLAALAADEQFVYRDVALEAIRIRELLSFATPRELALLTELWGPRTADVRREMDSMAERPRPACLEATPGTCRECGCTDEAACVPACWWVDDAHTSCSGCAYRAELQHTLDILLDGVPREGGSATRAIFESLICEAFASGALTAFQHKVKANGKGEA